MIKNFPKSRICVIDCQTPFQTGLQKAIDFARKNNITLNSADGRRLILGFCLKNIEEAYKTTKSQYPKVLCISQKAVTKKLQPFIDNHFDKMMSHLPVPYCGKYDLSSPDLEMAAESSLKQEKTNKKFQEFVLKTRLAKQT
jgi:hypothetical protein